MDLSGDGDGAWGRRRSRATRAAHWLGALAQDIVRAQPEPLLSRAAYGFGYGTGLLLGPRIRGPL